MARAHRRVQIGTVWVDTGKLFIIDPCYLESWQHGKLVVRKGRHGRREVDAEASSENSYGRVCLVTRDKGYGEVDLGVAVGNFGGDGGYPVFAEIDEQGMVATVTVDFSGGIGYQIFGM